MTEAGDKPKRRKLWRYLLVATGLGWLLVGIFAWYITTDSFQQMVRNRLVVELERITGGRVELGSIHTIPLQFRVEVRDLTIHGTEGPNQVPYAHADRLLAQMKVISVLGTRIGFDSLVLEHPVIHVILYPDGTTNQPEPKEKSTASENPVERLFDISIHRLEARRGEFLWNDQKFPMDFVVNDVSADMTYSFLHRRYETNVLLGKADTSLPDYRPISWTAEAHFTLSRNSLEVKSLKATSGRSHLVASGHIDDFHQPKIDANYDVTVDLMEGGAILRQPQLRRGTLQTTGHGTWDLSTFASTGRLLLREFDWKNEPLDLRNAAVTTEYSVTPQRLTLTKIDARLLGGVATGDADITNWLNATPASKSSKSKQSEEQQGTIRLRLRNISARELAATLASRKHPLNRLNLSGVAAGTVETRWKGSFLNSETAFALDLSSPTIVGPHDLPVKAHARGVYRALPGELELAEFNADTRATHVQASGTLSSRAVLKFSVNTTDLAEWQPVLVALGSDTRIPITLHGRATFNGTATGKLTDATLAGELQVEDFDSLFPATAHNPEKTVHWDFAKADIVVSDRAFSARNGLLHHGDTFVRFDGSATLQNGVFSETSPFNARVNMHQVDLAEMLTLAGYDYSATGVMNLSLSAAGTRAQPHAEGHVQLADAVIYGEPVQHFESDLHYSAGEAQFNNVQLAHYDARVTGGATYNPSTRAFRFNLTGTNFDLTRIPHLETTRVEVEGRADFTAVGSGTVEEPTINATVRIRDLTLDHERAGNLTIEAVTQGADLTLKGQSEFEHAELHMDGKVHLRDDWPSTIGLHFDHLDIDSLLRTYLSGHITGHSATAGDLELQGPLRKIHEINVTGNVTDLYADIENVKIRNQGPMRFSVNSQEFKLDQFHLIGEGTDVSANGSVELTGDRRLDLHSQGTLNLHLVESFNPDFTSSGVITVDANIGGTIARPVTQGKVQIANGSVAYIDLPSALSEINGTLLFNQNRLEIQSLTAHTGGGLVTFGGYATSYNRQLNFDLTVSGQGVRLRYPPGVSSTADADLHWAGSNVASTLSGDITVNKLAVTPGFDFGSALESTSQQSALPQTNPLLNRIKLDVHVVTAPELQMQTAIVRLSGDADLHLRGTAAKPVLLGRADILEGEAYFNGAKYRLERGDVTFTSPVSTTPIVDLQASTRIRDYDVTLSINGDPTKPNGLHVNYRSEPPLPEADIITLLALGRTQEEAAQLQQSGQSSLGQDASSAIIAEALNATVSNRVQRLFGVSRIKIDPQGLSTTETNLARGPQVTIEQQVTNNLTLTYSTSVSQTTQQIIQAEYNVTRNVSIVAIRDQNGVVSIDVRLRTRKK
jgi:translocation and assembly module TamB